MITRTFVDNEGKRHYARAATLEEAIVKRERMKAELDKGRSSSTPFKFWAETALDTYKPNVSDRYLSCMKSRLKNQILPAIGHIPLGKILPIQVQQILNNEKNRSRSHIKKLSQELFFYFDCAQKNGLIRKNPAADLTRPAGYQNTRRALTPVELEHFLKVCEHEPRFILFRLMLYCGCRPAEAYGVKYEDVTEIQDVKFLHIRGTKTANSDRLVPIPKEIYPDLVDTGRSGFVVRSRAGNQINETSYRRLVERLKRELNISMGCKVRRNQLIEPFPLADDFVPYLFRHTYCTNLKKMGVDIRIAKNLMGHADIKTTANIYDHDDGETLLLAAVQMGLTDI